MISAYRIVRYLMIIFNLIFLLCGIGVLIAGIVIRADRDGRLLYLEVCDKFDFHSVSYITIASGVFIILVSSVGFFGSLRESRSILISFCCCLFTLFLMEVAVGIVAVVFKNDIEDGLKKCMNGTLLDYYTDEQSKKSWNDIQEEISCCGVLSSKDYQYAKSRPFNNSTPLSCRSNLDEGCHTKLKEKASDELAILAVIAGFIAFVELMGISMALWIICKISEKFHT